MTYTPALPPWQHQQTALDRARDQSYFAFLMEMGTGKTKVVIDEFCRMYTEDKVDTVLIVAPKGVYMNWVRGELPTHVPRELQDELSVSVWGGGGKAHQAQLQAALEHTPGLRVHVMNTEALSSGTRAFNYAVEFLQSGYPGSYMALDESTYIKNPSAQRTKAVVALGDSAGYRRIMSGLPVPRGPLDLWAQSEFLRPGILGSTFYGFRNRYAVLKDQRFGGRKVTLVVGYRNIDELTQRIEPWSFRVTKEECLDLPPKVYTIREVELTDEQMRMYAEMRDFAIAEIDSSGATVTATVAITAVLRLQQLVCGHVKSDDGELLPVPTNRVSTLMEILGETDGKVIVWSKFRHDITKIVGAVREEYGDEAVAQFHGGNTSDRHLEAERFMTDPRCRFMVASYAGGHGNTWVVADTVVYFSNDYDLEKRAQSEDRAHRAGQTADHVTYIDMIARGTVDEKIVRALREKINLAASITGDNFREWVV